MTIKAHEKRIVNFLINEYLLQHGYRLTSITFSDENNDAEYFEDWDNIGINVTKPPNLLKLYKDYGKHFSDDFNVIKEDIGIMTDEDNAQKVLTEKLESEILRIATLENKLNAADDDVKRHSNTIEQLNLQLQEKESVIEILKSSSEISAVDSPKKQEPSSPKVENQVEIHEEDNEFLKKMTEKICPDINDETLNLNDDIINELSESLPKIVPNILLNKREELLPLLLLAIQHHPESQTRDQLLNLLFNLIKKPDSDQRIVILRGFKKIAKCLGRQKVEAELLPQLWEQLDHKYVERRTLVCQTCAVLLPYIPNELISSLVFSMLQQLALEDKDEQVRQSAISSFSLLVLYLKSDSNKTDQVLEIMETLLKDPSNEIVHTVHDTFLHSIRQDIFEY